MSYATFAFIAKFKLRSPQKMLNSPLSLQAALSLSICPPVPLGAPALNINQVDDSKMPDQTLPTNLLPLKNSEEILNRKALEDPYISSVLL